MDENTKQKIQEIRVLEHNLQQVLMQKQAMELELNETLNAIQELYASKDKEVYKMMGSIMLKASHSKVSAELEEKKKILEIRVQALEKQQRILESKGKELHEEIKKSLKTEDKN